MAFDADLVCFRFEGDPNGPLGLGLVLDYAGREYRPVTMLSGARQKFVLREAGVILKVEAYERSKHCGDYEPQTVGEWAVYDALPKELRSYFQPVVAHAWQLVKAPQPGTHPDADFFVIWSAQLWLDGRDAALNRETYDHMVARADEYGFHPHDHSPRQIRTPQEGLPVWLDYGYFCRPGACRCEDRKDWESGNTSDILPVQQLTPTQGDQQ